MRCQQFLNTIHNAFNNGEINLQRAAFFAQNDDITGGWEVWLQLEIMHGFLNVVGNWTCEREHRYPSTDQQAQYLTYNPNGHRANGGRGPVWNVTNNRRDAARADFYLSRTAGMADDAYIELKCVLPNLPNPLRDAWDRFAGDVVKQQTLQDGNAGLNYISLLATFGIFQQDDVAVLNANLDWCWTEGRTAYVYDVDNAQVSTLQNVALNGTPRLFLLAVSV